MQHWLAWWPTLIVVAVAVCTDMRSRRIPNWLVLPFLLLGIMVSPLRADWSGIRLGFWLPKDWPSIRQGLFSGHGFGWHGLGQSFAGMGLGLLVFGIPFWMGWTGGGDVKLCAAIGAWVGPQQMFFSLFFSSLIGGILLLCWAAWGGFSRELFTDTSDFVFGWMQRRKHCEAEQAIANPSKRKMPYAPAIAIGTLLSFFA
jgi:prepilin peptidase CpaA